MNHLAQESASRLTSVRLLLFSTRLFLLPQSAEGWFGWPAEAAVARSLAQYPKDSRHAPYGDTHLRRHSRRIVANSRHSPHRTRTASAKKIEIKKEKNLLLYVLNVVFLVNSFFLIQLGRHVNGFGYPPGSSSLLQCYYGSDRYTSFYTCIRNPLFPNWSSTMLYTAVVAAAATARALRTAS